MVTGHDLTKHESLIVGLQAEIKALNDNVVRLTSGVDENTKQLSRLAVLENDYSHQSSALGRAFSEIEQLRSDITDKESKNDSDHSVYFKYIWISTGFCIAVSIMWTLVGYRVNSQIDETVKTVHKMGIHIASDKITSEADLKGITK